MKRLLLTLMCAAPLQAMVVPATSLQEVRLLNSNKHVYVEDENAAYRIAPHNMNKELREAFQRKVLDKYKEAAQIKANRQFDGTYTLYGKVRGKGGTGPLTAGVVNMAVRVGCWTGYLLAVTAPATVGTVVAGPMGGSAGTVATGVVLTQVGGAAAVAAGIESLATKLTLATLLLPIPLP